ncbi:hypothetical protein [Couchioplanes azureus]|uniref:hypothetical protein n=1 Tax=Couchioplanes caeruleus TaxID=56438 RepID=UPI00166FD127|nr:hypothetical protein [Couchioplanes caeruleus]GGQ83254.1 hypothetical protein GCM10010166_61920 [Couchioplanes caeruleus subsp. azureus]
MSLTHRRSGRWLGALLALVVMFVLQAATATPASAGPGEAMQKCERNWPDSHSWTADISGTSRLVTAMGNLEPGSVIRITASGSVHNGSWFGQWRGPTGSFDDPAPDASWPAPRVDKFALYGTWLRSGSPFHAGTNSGCLDYTSARAQGNGPDELGVGVNDDVHHDNSGSFRVTIRVWTNSSEVSDAGFEGQSTSSLSAPWSGEGRGFKGVDLNRRFAHTGRDNSFVHTGRPGWNAITQRIRVMPNRMYRMTAWVRTSGNFTSGVFGVRPITGGTPAGSARFGEYAPPRYQPLVLDFNSGQNGELTAFIGYWSPGYDSWMQVDDVRIWAH